MRARYQVTGVRDDQAFELEGLGVDDLLLPFHLLGDQAFELEGLGVDDLLLPFHLLGDQAFELEGLGVS